MTTPTRPMSVFDIAGRAMSAQLMRLNTTAPFDSFHGDDNLGDEAPFPSTWQLLASGDAPND